MKKETTDELIGELARAVIKRDFNKIAAKREVEELKVQNRKIIGVLAVM